MKWRVLEVTKTAVVASVCVAAAVQISAADEPARSDTSNGAVRLSSEEMAETMGGSSVNFRFPPSAFWAQPADNPAFEFDFSSGMGAGDILMELYTTDTSTKVWGQLVTGPAPGGVVNVRTRTNWPLDTDFHNVQVSHCTPLDPLCGNSAPSVAAGTLLLQRISPDQRVGGVVFHELNGVTAVPPFIYELDDLGVWGYDPVNGNRVDEVLGQCWNMNVFPGFAKPNWNLRHIETRQNTVTPVCLIAGLDNAPCQEEFRAIANSPGNLGLLHVFVGTAPGNLLGQARSYGNIILIDDDLSAYDFATVLAHETGHSLGLGHTDQTCTTVGATCAPLCTIGHSCPVEDASLCTLSGCDDPVNPFAAASAGSCSGAIPTQNRNLMCTFGGRILTPRQCDWMENSGEPNSLTVSCLDPLQQNCN